MKGPRYSLLAVIATVAMLLLLAAPVSAEGDGEELQVGPDKEYATIQEAVDEAESGSKILVYPGEYEESVKVETDDLEIVAEGDGVKVTSPDEGEACFEVKADHVVIKGFELTGPPLTAR